MHTGQAIVECLRAEGVRHVFGLVGSSHLEIVDSIARSNDIQLVAVRHEQAAAFMADAYARVTGGFGVVLTSSGPGVSNTITGIALAQRVRQVCRVAGVTERGAGDRLPVGRDAVRGPRDVRQDACHLVNE